MKDERVLSDKRGLGFEVVTVMSVACLTVLVGSLVFVFCNGEKGFWRYQFSWSVGTGLLHQLLAVLLCIYVVFQRGQSLRDLGLVLRVRVIPTSVGLFVVVGALDVVLTAVAGLSTGNTTSTVGAASLQSLGETPFPMSAAFIMTGAVREDLLGRAYLITRLEQLGWTTTSAVVMSAFLAGACHLYQGPLQAMLTVPGSLLLSLYFARYRNITAIILAHVYYNALWMALA